MEVIVPVYGDYAATKACLDALEAEGSRTVRHVTVIDDCSPDADVRALVTDRAARRLFTLLRNTENLGFARSVNRVLERIPLGDVLLLNADTVLTKGAIDRLALAAYSEARVATVTPFSNNGEFTSFPKPNVCNELPTANEIAALDEIASATNGQGIVDLPSGVGFCLYITRACLDAVGLLSESYSRGYYEDVDYCLRAREAGLRNVCATGVYVGHAGSRSFRSEKRRLVVRNLKILNERFPDHELECLAFINADPLSIARTNLEEQLGPEGTVVLLMVPAMSDRALALARPRQIEGQGSDLHCIRCEVDDRNASVRFKSVRECAPQSLTFSLADDFALGRLQAYLRRLRPQAIELLAPRALPDAALRVAFALQIPVRLALGDLDWMFDRKLPFGGACLRADRPGYCRTCVCPEMTVPPLNEGAPTVDQFRTYTVTGKAESVVPVVPMDRMADAFCAVHIKSKLRLQLATQQNTSVDAIKVKRARAVLGILCPEATAETDRQILALERAFDQQCTNASIVVLGRCLYELGIMSGRRIFVTGVIEEDEYERALRQYGITHLLSPYRTRHFGLVDRLSSAFGLSKGYFDWSFGVMDGVAGDLALDPRICFERAALEIGAWLADSPIETLRAMR